MASINVSKILEINENRIANSICMKGVSNKTMIPSLIPSPPGERIINIPKTMLSAKIPGRIRIRVFCTGMNEINRK